MARITREEVERIADLARLTLSAEEAQALTHDLDTMLEYVQALDGLDTQNVEPTAHPLPVATALRPDRARPSLAPEEAVGNAPEREGSAFTVPKVIEGVES